MASLGFLLRELVKAWKDAIMSVLPKVSCNFIFVAANERGVVEGKLSQTMKSAGGNLVGNSVAITASRFTPVSL